MPKPVVSPSKQRKRLEEFFRRCCLECRQDRHGACVSRYCLCKLLEQDPEVHEEAIYF